MFYIVNVNIHVQGSKREYKENKSYTKDQVLDSFFVPTQVLMYHYPYTNPCLLTGPDFWCQHLEYPSLLSGGESTLRRRGQDRPNGTKSGQKGINKDT